MVHQPKFSKIVLQTDPVSEVGVNGDQIDDILQYCRDMLAHFNEPPYKCFENDSAIAHLDRAIAMLASRTRKRVERGVEGTSTP